MRRARNPAVGWAVVVVASGALTACGFMKKFAPPSDAGAVDAAVEAAASAEVTPGQPGGDASAQVIVPPAPLVPAANEAQVTRYPAEQAERGPLTVDVESNLRTAVPSGDLVLILKRGTEVEKVAEYTTYYLIEADDPKDPSRKLLGWVSSTAFSSVAPTPKVVVAGDGGAKPVVVVTDAGAKPATVVDAGAKPVVPVVDAGAKPVAPKPLDVKKSATGTCPAGYGACSAICRLTCKADAECGLATAHCNGGFCLGPNTLPCK